MLALVLLAACEAASPEPVQGPRGARTTQHVEQARKHDEIARSRTSWPVTEEVAPAPMVPFVVTWDPDSDHERMARHQGSKAAANEKEFRDACGQREVEKVVGSPLTRHRVGGWNTDDGVVVLLSVVAGPKARLLADLRCYRAWLLAGTDVDKDSPLALPGLLVEAEGTQDGITLTLTVKDTALIPELQRRVMRQLELLRRLPRHED